MPFTLNNSSGFKDSTPTTLGNGLVLYFSLANFLYNGNAAGPFSASIPNYSEFQALFDRFRIAGVRVILVPAMNVAQTNTSNIAIPVVQIAHDYDDATAPTSATMLLERQDTKLIRLDKPHTIQVRPKTAGYMLDSTGAAQPTGQFSPWLDTTAQGAEVLHYGIKLWSMQTAGGAGTDAGTVFCFVELDLEFKTPR